MWEIFWNREQLFLFDSLSVLAFTVIIQNEHDVR